MATKKLSDLTTVTTPASGGKVVMTDTSGHGSLITPGNLRNSILNNVPIRAIYCPVQVLYHNSSGAPTLCSPYDWVSSLQSSNTADGVALTFAGYGTMVIDLVDAPSNLRPYASGGNGNIGKTYTSAASASADFDGEGNTNAAKSNTYCGTDGTSTAYGYCLHRASAGIGAGKWWLPSLGEMLLISDYLPLINHVLSLITGAEQLIFEKRQSSDVCSYMTSTPGASGQQYYTINMHSTRGVASVGGAGRYVRAITKLQ